MNYWENMNLKIKMIAIVILCAFFGSVTAQNKRETSIKEFSTIKVYDLIELNLIPSTENKVVISGSNPEEVEVVQNGSTLKIRMQLKKLFKGTDVEVNVYYTNLNVIDANEGCIITANNLIKQNSLEIRTQEGAKVDANLELEDLKIRAVTGGIIDVKGAATNQDISIYTGGIYNAENLITQTTTVRINAAGEAYVNANQNVDAKIRAGGDVYVYGNPGTISENIALGGSLKRMN